MTARLSRHFEMPHPPTRLRAVARRFGSFLFSMLLVVNLVPLEGECSEHSTHDTGSTAVVTNEHDRHSAHDAKEPVNSEPCDSTDKSDCCAAVESCSSSHAIRTSHSSATSVAPHPSISVFDGRAPAYLIRPPEPPPPKA